MLVDHDRSAASGMAAGSTVRPGRRAVALLPPLGRQIVWAKRYSGLLYAIEVLAAAAVAALLATTSAGNADRGLMTLAATALVVGWPVLLSVLGAHSERVFGTGSDEYRRVGRAGLVLLALTGFISYAMVLELSRAFVVLAMPALVVVTAIGRYAARCYLRPLP